MDKIIAIYVRRSRHDDDSFSIAAQESECIKYVQEHFPNSEYKVYCEDGKSGKDILHRPQFLQLMTDVKGGEVGKIVIKKYDRFGRDMTDYLNVIRQLDSYGVPLISLVEAFDGETNAGQFSRNVMFSFAEMERKMIAARVADNYAFKAVETGYYQGGTMCYGYIAQRQNVNGKEGSVLVPSPQAEVVRIAYEMYAKHNTSLQDIIVHFQKTGIDTVPKWKNKEFKPLSRGYLSRLLKSPLYVKADEEVYRYYSAKGVKIIDDISAFDGKHGLFLHNADLHKSKNKDLQPFVKVGYHEGIIDSATWLAVQDKKAHNKRIPSRLGAAYTWLGGLVKCADCGYALSIHCNHNKAHTKIWRYYNDRGAYTLNGCGAKRLKTRPDDVEAIVFAEMKEHLKQYEVKKKEQSKPSSEVANLTRSIISKEAEIDGYISKLAFADDEITVLIMERVKRLNVEVNELKQKLRTVEAKQKSIDTDPLSEPLERWNELTVDEKNAVAVKMINVIKVSDSKGIEIEFSF